MKRLTNSDLNKMLENVRKHILGMFPEKFKEYDSHPTIKFGMLRNGRLGECKYRYIPEIIISYDLQESPKEIVENTVAHEFIHSLTCCQRCGHKGNFKKIADQVTRYGNYDISTHASVADSKEFHKARVNKLGDRTYYVLTCDHCGYEFIREKKSRFVNDYKNYWHRCRDGEKGHFTLEVKNGPQEEINERKELNTMGKSLYESIKLNRIPRSNNVKHKKLNESFDANEPNNMDTIRDYVKNASGHSGSILIDGFTKDKFENPDFPTEADVGKVMYDLRVYPDNKGNIEEVIFEPYEVIIDEVDGPKWESTDDIRDWTDEFNINWSDEEVKREAEKFLGFNRKLREAKKLNIRKPIKEAEVFEIPKEIVDKVNKEFDEAKPQLIKDIKREFNQFKKELLDSGYFDEKELDDIPEVKAYKDAINDPDDIWCNCDGNIKDSMYKDDGESYLGVSKHGYICPNCKKYTQIG